ncbi:hypothetical protein EMIHUDRAFT_445317 [Emiliania huxleyi CCMP1516]|uniref:rRNA biogenesis protein RRP36 n=2 Tax=Emiliania huxleyi TaxID=2903 RepID=A0A0D3J089_EMIH1|nr:hypothetical protein EMIHUDRAFT_445317 [Emiliania huxleyi CCMP1516]EOD16924.1 hypothetical protein EMIHUDRAFT_445317 [Emiliania huxleyi CCMP1516]|eukprot:XP_005769353.1 hypothetical protein EMIHUDRAFT_445317 [Emiliania huxleyi CCMP1516]
MEIQPRANKNRPAQQSTKRAVSTLRVAPGLSASAGAGKSGRDPRFDAVSKGAVDEHAWRQKYGFVFDKQREEVRQLKSTLASAKAAAKAQHAGAPGAKRKRRKRGASAAALPPHEVEALKLELSRKSNQLMAHDQAAERQRLKSAVRKKEVVAVAAGKRPYYKKAREIREEQLTEQFQQLEKSGRLDNYMAKKRKQRASKQRKALPTYSDYTT